MPILAGIRPSCVVRSAETQPPAHMCPTVGAMSGVCGAAAGKGGSCTEEGVTVFLTVV